MLKKTTRTEEALIKKRLLSAMPNSKFEMETLCRLAGIKTTRLVGTAAVECKRRPNLLINPDFVAQYCARDEHLFLLVMHELWHVMLGHTRMYPKMTKAQNIAFDAIINAEIMRQFPQPEYQGFFDVTNPPDQFPHCLLRPPVGWPNNPQYPDDVGPSGTKELLQRLYPPFNFRRFTPPMYEDVLNLLVKSGMDLMGDQPLLIGNHGDIPLHDPIMKEMMAQITSNWEVKPGQGFGKSFFNSRYRIQESSEDMQRAFARVLRQCLIPKTGANRKKAKVAVSMIGGNGVLPNPYDRMSYARRQLGMPETIWAQPSQVKARLPEKPSRALIYLDVSGSMNFILGQLMHLILPYVARKQAEIFQFSNKVIELNYADLRQAKLNSTGGTDINCVLQHLTTVTADRVLLLTDGMVGEPDVSLKNQVMETGIKLYTVLPNNGNLNATVEQMSTAVVRLPPEH